MIPEEECDHPTDRRRYGSNQYAEYSHCKMCGKRLMYKARETPLGKASSSSQAPSGRKPREKTKPHEPGVPESYRCECGLKAVTYVVKKAGPNVGRKFHRCPLPMGQQCDYFQWDLQEENDFLKKTWDQQAQEDRERRKDAKERAKTEEKQTLTDLAGSLGASIAESLNQGMTESARIHAHGAEQMATAISQLTNATLTQHAATVQAFSELRASQEETNQLLRGVSRPPNGPA